MLKTHGYRKLVLVMAFVLGTGLSLIACATQSSTDDAASHPGDNFIGSIVVTVDPTTASMDISQVNEALTNTSVTADATFSVSTTTVSWDAANNITYGNVRVKWKGTQRLEDVRIGVFNTDTTGANANAMNDETPSSLSLRDNCRAYSNFGTAIAGGCNPGYTYVGDEVSDGPETEVETDWTGGARFKRYQRLMCPDCGVTTARWALRENTVGNTKYTFSAYLFGTKHARYIYNDSRFDADTATVVAKAYRPNFSGSTNRSTRPALMRTFPLSTVKTGEWFYVQLWFDAPGNTARNDDTWPPCRHSTTGNPAASQCYTDSPATMLNYDFYFVEDVLNRNAGLALQTTGMSSAKNTGYLYGAGAYWSIKWDPAVLRSNCTVTTWSDGSSGTITFWTKGGTTGTQMDTISEESTTDRYTITSRNAMNYMGDARGLWEASYSIPTTFPPIGDGIDTYGTASFTQGDINAGKVAFKAIGLAGDGARIEVAPTTNTLYYAGLGGGGGTYNGAFSKVAQKSPNYPKWAGMIGTETNGPVEGFYNEQPAWVCIK